MQDQKNTILAIVLSAIVLIGWQYFFATPQANRQRQLAEQQRQEQVEKQPAAPAGTAGSPAANAPQTPGQAGSAAAPQPREKVLAATPRVEIDTPSVKGSIDLRGARLDDLSLVKYRETVDPNSPIVVLLAPSGTEEPFYAEFGWIAGAGTTLKLPNADTVWRQDGSGALQVGHPVTLVYDNGEGLEFHRTIGVDDKYLFTIEDSVSNKGDGAGHALSLWADLAPRHAQDARLLHPARRLHWRARRRCAGEELQIDRGKTGRLQ